MSIFPKFFFTLFKGGLVRPIWERVSALYLNFLDDNYIVSGTPSTFDSYVTHSRNGNATMTDSDGLIKWAPHNLLLYSEGFTTGWNIQAGVTVTPNQAIAPDGSFTAAEVTGNGSNGVYQSTLLVAGVVATRAIWLKGVSGGETVIIKDPVLTGTILTCNLTTSWQLFELEENNGHASSQGLWVDDIPVGGIFVWGAHLYRSDLGGMVDNPDRGDSYVPTTSSAVYLPRRGHHVYNGSTWVNEGLLVESESRQNIYLYSENSGAWSPQNATITANVTTAPDGNTTADNFANNDAGLIAFHYAKNSIILTTSTQYTLSVFAKYNTGSGIIWLLGETSADKFCYFDIQNGLVTLSTNFDNATITDYGNGWYRCAATFTKTSATSSEEIGVGVCLTSGTPNFDSTGIANQEQVYLWGAQLEEGSTPSSYIPTAGSAITRAAETLTIPSANLPWPTPNVIGPELVTNGTFDTDTSGWTTQLSASVAWVSGEAEITASATNNSGISQSISFVVGKVYIVTATVRRGTCSDVLRVGVNGIGDVLTYSTSNVTLTFIFVATLTSHNVQVVVSGTSSSGQTAYVDNFSVKEIDPLSVSIQMDGRMTYADTTPSTEAVFTRWLIDSNNRIENYLISNGATTGQYVSLQSSSGIVDLVATSGTYYSPGILVPYNIASRHGSTFINGAVEGTALTANTTPVALPDLSSTDLELAYDYMGTIRTFRIWDADLTDEGIAYVSERSEEPTISLSFNSSESSFTVSDWLP